VKYGGKPFPGIKSQTPLVNEMDGKEGDGHNYEEPLGVEGEPCQVGVREGERRVNELRMDRDEGSKSPHLEEKKSRGGCGVQAVEKIKILRFIWGNHRG